MRIKNKVVLISGGVVRVGRAIALEMLAANAIVYCHYNSSEAEALQLQKEYPGIKLIKGDLRDVIAIQSIVRQVVRESGKIDILINNAAVFIKTPLGTVTEKDWEQLFTLNLKAAFFLAREVSQIMVKSGEGKIINIADTCGLRPWPSFIPYGLTKSGIISMTKGLAKALAPNVQVNAVSPGPVLLPDYYTETERKNAMENTLLKREGKAEDVAAAVKFLIEDGDYITGLELAVDGGRNLNG